MRKGCFASLLNFFSHFIARKSVEKWHEFIELSQAFGPLNLPKSRASSTSQLHWDNPLRDKTHSWDNSALSSDKTGLNLGSKSSQQTRKCQEAFVQKRVCDVHVRVWVSGLAGFLSTVSHRHEFCGISEEALCHLFEAFCAITQAYSTHEHKFH